MTHSLMFLKLRTQLMGLCLLGLCLVGGAKTVQAYDPTARISMAGSFGMSSPLMSDVNDQIGRGNVYMAERDWIPIDKIHSIFAVEFGLRTEVFGNWMASVGTGRIAGNRGVDFDEVVDVEPSANFFQALAIYRLPWRPAESIRMAAAAGYITTLSANMKITHEHRQVEQGTRRIEELDVDLSGSGGLGFLEAEFIMTERFTLSLQAGYRLLNTTQDSETWTISRLSDDGLGDGDGDDIQDFEDLSDRSYIRRSFLSEDQVDSEGRLSELDAADFDVDFSGPTINIALRVYLF